jgi:hypothetical protein
VIRQGGGRKAAAFFFAAVVPAIRSRRCAPRALPDQCIFLLDDDQYLGQ